MAFLYPKLFPDCLPETADGDLEMPLEDAMALVWKARTLKFTISLTVTGLFSDSDGIVSITNTYDTEFIFFPTLDDGSLDPQPLEKMSDIICGSYTNIFEDGTNFFGGTIIGDYIFIQSGGSLPYSGSFRSSFQDFEFGPLSVRTAGEARVCDFRYRVLSNPFGEGNDVPVFYVSTGIPYGDDHITATIPNGAVIKVNGNTYSTDIYCRSEAPGPSAPTYDSLTATGQILIEIESERLAE